MIKDKEWYKELTDVPEEDKDKFAAVPRFILRRTGEETAKEFKKDYENAKKGLVWLKKKGLQFGKGFKEGWKAMKEEKNEEETN